MHTNRFTENSDISAGSEARFSGGSNETLFSGDIGSLSPLQVVKEVRSGQGDTLDDVLGDMGVDLEILQRTANLGEILDQHPTSEDVRDGGIELPKQTPWVIWQAFPGGTIADTAGNWNAVQLPEGEISRRIGCGGPPMVRESGFDRILQTFSLRETVEEKLADWASKVSQSNAQLIQRILSIDKSLSEDVIEMAERVLQEISGDLLDTEPTNIPRITDVYIGFISLINLYKSLGDSLEEALREKTAEGPRDSNGFGGQLHRIASQYAWAEGLADKPEIHKILREAFQKYTLADALYKNQQEEGFLSPKEEEGVEIEESVTIPPTPLPPKVQRNSKNHVFRAATPREISRQ